MKQIWSIVTSALLLAALGCVQQQNPVPSVKPSAVPSVQTHSVSRQTAASDAFDFYLLNLSWSPEYCHSHPSATECAQHAAFVMHGLWPEKTDGTYPENCSAAPGPTDPSKYADIYPDAGLLQHEWRAHGTCSGLSPDDFFTDARSAYKSVKIPAKLTQLTAPTSLSPDQLSALFQQSNPGLPATSIVISCGNNYLTAVEVCLDKTLHATSCGSVKTCRANQVRIPNP